MQVTDVRINRVQNGNGGQLKAFASVTFDDVLVIRDFCVVKGEKGIFVSFPRRKGKEGDKFYDIAFPLNREFRQAISQKVLVEYEGSAN